MCNCSNDVVLFVTCGVLLNDFLFDCVRNVQCTKTLSIKIKQILLIVLMYPKLRSVSAVMPLMYALQASTAIITSCHHDTLHTPSPSEM